MMASLMMLVCLNACKKDEQTSNTSLSSSNKNSARTLAWETVLDGSSLASYAAFDANWNYLYPWGPSHNGSAKMVGSSTDHSQIYLSNNILYLKATPIANPVDRFHYLSGTVWAKHIVNITDQYPQYEIKGTFQCPSAKGTWPAFWISGTQTWPPESDIMEFKGNNTNWQNTFITSSNVQTVKTVVSSPASWHVYRVWINKVNATEVDIHYYIDGAWKAVHRANFVNKPMWVIFDLQMEGSSGTPGPTGTTYLLGKDFYIGRTKAF